MNELVARRDPAGPAFAGIVEAELVDRRRIDPAQANARAADHDLIAIVDLRDSRDVGGLRHRRQQNKRNRGQQFGQHAKGLCKGQYGIRRYFGSELWCGFGSGASARHGLAVNLTR
jgi:hypothetical protein